MRRATTRGISAVIALVLVATSVQVVDSRVARAVGAPQAGAAPVSAAFAMGGQLGGSIDQRTGSFSASMPLVSIRGRGGVDATWSLGYSQALAAQGIDRFGLGAGWSLGVPWVDTIGGVRVYPAAGGSYTFDEASPTGLHQYPLKDLAFAETPGVLPARLGVPDSLQYTYILRYLDGSHDYFDDSGNLVARQDRFDNRIDISWLQSGRSWQPRALVDNYGEGTSFDHSNPDQVTVTSAPRADGTAASIVLTLYQGRLVTLVDPARQETDLQYTSVPGVSDPLLSLVISPTGAQTKVSYTPVSYEPALTVVKSVRVTDAGGADMLAERDFTLDPPNNAQHNYTGYPTHVAAGSDGLFNSGDKNYRYSTELSDGRSMVKSTYNSLHLLVSQQVFLLDQFSDSTLWQSRSLTYPEVASPADLPANYSDATRHETVYGDPTFGATRTVVTTSTYDDQGLLVSATDATGTVTASSFDPRYGLPTSQTVTGVDGALRVIANTLTSDGKAIQSSTTSVGTAGQKPSARAVVDYGYNSAGELVSRSIGWAPGAKPSGPSGGPDVSAQTRTVTVDPAAHTRTDVITIAPDTSVASSATTVRDLVTGAVLTATNAANRTTAYAYDAAGRVVAVTGPDHLRTATAYTPLTTTTTTPDGHVSRVTTDVLGRTIKITDSVRNEKLVSDPTARTVSTTDYSVDGSTITTTGPAGAASSRTTTKLDSLGRTVQTLKASGIAQNVSYDDVAHTATTSLVPAGGQSTHATSVTVESFDAANRAISSATAYSDSTTQPATSQSYDGLGRVTSVSANDVTATPSYTGAGGLQIATDVTPENTAKFPGAPLTASTRNILTGEPTVKTLTPVNSGSGGGPATGTPGNSGVTYSYDAAGRVSTATDRAQPNSPYRYTYAPDGQVATETTPAGELITHLYDPTTGRLAETDVTSADKLSTQKTAYRYDPGTGRRTAVYDPDRPADIITYGYDADGHATSIRYPDGSQTSAAYADTGQLDTTTDITGALTTYLYQPTGELSRATQTRAGSTLATVAYTYDSLDRVKSITRGNGVQTLDTYTDANLLKTQTTTAADGTRLSLSSYDYDAHQNLVARTDQIAVPSSSSGPRPLRQKKGAAENVSTTTYRYDAYDRLVDSRTYPAATATGTPNSETAYTLDVSGNVLAATTTSTGADGAKHVTETSNSIDVGGRLTSRTVNGTQTQQAFDADGNVTRDLSGNSYTYNQVDQPTSVTTADGNKTTYAYWPDRTRRSSTTTVGGTAATTTFHYNADGVLSNDTYTNAPILGGRFADTPGTTASYLSAVGRESRTLIANLGSVGRKSIKQAPVRTTADGNGYYLSDRHGSVTAMIDGTGRVTSTYHYDDYGLQTVSDGVAARTGAVSPAARVGAANATTNPFTYAGVYTNPETGTQYLPARIYDPSQGRFLSRDSANLYNRYQAFNANPISYTDPTGHISVPDWIVDLVSAVLFVGFAVLSGVAAVEAGAAIYGAIQAGEELAVSVVANAVLNTVSTLANIGAAVTSGTLGADDVYGGITGHHFLSDDQRSAFTTANFALGSIAGATSIAAPSLPEAGKAAAAGEAATKATADDVAAVAKPTSRVISPDATGTPSADAPDLVGDSSRSANPSQEDRALQPRLTSDPTEQWNLRFPTLRLRVLAKPKLSFAERWAYARVSKLRVRKSPLNRAEAAQVPEITAAPSAKSGSLDVANGTSTLTSSKGLAQTASNSVHNTLLSGWNLLEDSDSLLISPDGEGDVDLF